MMMMIQTFRIFPMKFECLIHEEKKKKTENFEWQRLRIHPAMELIHFHFEISNWFLMLKLQSHLFEINCKHSVYEFLRLNL